MPHSPEKKERFVKLRWAGKSLNEISVELGIAKSTASLWSKDVAISQQGQDRLKRRRKEGIVKGGASTARIIRKEYREIRETAWTQGFESSLTNEDALCVGLYWGEGAKSEMYWKFSNADRKTVALMVSWAKRSDLADEFAAVVYAYDDSPHTDLGIRRFWRKAGISKVTVVRLRSKGDPRKRGRLPFGTCHVRARKSGAKLYAYYEGQRDQLIANSAR